MTLSGGQAKRLAIIRALLHKPKLLFLDEPTAALDVEGRQQFYRALAEVSQNEGTTIVWTSHYLQEIYEQCERVVMLISGKIVLDSPVSALASYSEVQSVKIQLAQGIQLAPEEESRLSIRSLNPSELMYQGTADELYSRVFPQLQREGIRVQRVTHDEASLEDIYLSLVERHRGSSL
jgi:ABC-2 type transport system ATP-binding protein